MRCLAVAACCALLASPTAGQSQFKEAAHIPEELRRPGVDPTAAMWSVTILAGAIIILCAVAMYLQYRLTLADKASDASLRAFGFLGVLFLASIVIVAGFGPAQIAPLMTILGTALGYLFGKDATAKKS